MQRQVYCFTSEEKQLKVFIIIHCGMPSGCRSGFNRDLLLQVTNKCKFNHIWSGLKPLLQAEGHRNHLTAQVEIFALLRETINLIAFSDQLEVGINTGGLNR